MPDRSSRRRGLAVLVLTAGALVTALAAPAVIAQEAEPWAGSRFDGSVTEEHKSQPFDIRGTFIRSDGAPIFDVDVRFERGAYPTADMTHCPIPPDEDDVPRVSQTTTSTTSPGTPESTFQFEVVDTAWPCNGTYDVVAEASAASTNARRKELRATFEVAVPPVPVPSMEATVAGDDKAPDPATGATADDPATVTVTWDQLDDPHDDYPDFVGYRVRRAGPAGDAKFDTISDLVIEHDDENQTRAFTDTIEAPGEYRYRVQSLRAGPEGSAPEHLVPSADAVTPAVTVAIAGPPTTTPSTSTTPTTRRSLTIPNVGRGTDNPRSPLNMPTTPTTLDTGFDEELDYSDLPEPGDELAGQGQSVIQTDDPEGAGLLGPVAGAMVLLGWAGHVAYLNRLAKQF